MTDIAITEADRENVKAFLAGAGLQIGDPSFDAKRVEGFIDVMALYGKALAGLVAEKARIAALEQCAREGVPTPAMGEAIGALLGEARRDAIEEAAKVAEAHNSDTIHPGAGWQGEEAAGYAYGADDASSLIAQAIRALTNQPHNQEG